MKDVMAQNAEQVVAMILERVFRLYGGEVDAAPDGTEAETTISDGNTEFEITVKRRPHRDPDTDTPPQGRVGEAAAIVDGIVFSRGWEQVDATVGTEQDPNGEEEASAIAIAPTGWHVKITVEIPQP